METVQTVEELIAAHKKDEATFEFTLESGETFKARQFKNGSEFMALEKRVPMVQEVVTKTPSQAWQPYLKNGLDSTILKQMLYIETLIIEPVITFYDCLRLHHECEPGFILSLGEALIRESESRFFGTVKKDLDTEKNE